MNKTEPTPRIFMYGDSHGSIYMLRRQLEHVADKERPTLIIHVGDFGMGFHDFSSYACLDQLCGILRKNNATMLVIRGNHDDPKFWQEEYTYKNITFLPDYTERIINGLNFYFVGGAISVDRVDRTEGASYWRDEGVNTALWPAKAPKRPVNVLVTHSAPSCAWPVGQNNDLVRYFCGRDETLMEELVAERAFLQRVLDAVKPARHYYGHFHNSKTECINGCRHTLLDIDEMIELI